jgi:hypothetical protein
MYNADITETPKRDGTFVAVLRQDALSVTSRDPEHDLCATMVDAGMPDGPIQFWRRETPSLHFKSTHTAARYRITLGDQYPRRVKRGSVENLQDFPLRPHGDGQIGGGGYDPSRERERACG